jgi:hypothetical protein
MKKLTIIVSVVIIGFIMASCGNKEKDMMNKANELYAQAETELNAIDNWDDFVTFFQNFKQKSDDFKAGYSNLKLSQETQDFLSDKKEAFDQMESQKAGELFEPILVKGEQFAKTFTDFSLLYSLLYFEENVIEEKIRNILGVASDASDEELQKAMEKKENWKNTTLGITSDASDEEKNKALEDWIRTNIGIDSYKSEEDGKKAIEHLDSIYGNEISVLKSFDRSSDELKDVLPKDLKERFEKYNNTMAEITEIFTLAGFITLEKED